MEVPDDAPERCPACGDAYDSVSRHAGGLTVALRGNERYARVCFEPVTVNGDGRRTDGDGAGRVDFYHHTHEQADVAASE